MPRRLATPGWPMAGSARAAKAPPQPMEFIEAPSPNFDQRTGLPDILVLHYTGMQTGEAALERLRDPEAKVSSHYLVEEDGRIFLLVAEERRRLAGHRRCERCLHRHRDRQSGA